MTENFNAMEDALNNVLDVQVGDFVKGEVLTVQDNKQVIVGIVGAGAEGVIPAKEISASPVEQLAQVVKVGDVLDLVVISTIKDKENGSFLLSKRLVDVKKAWQDAAEKFAPGTRVEGTVTQVVKGGLIVDLGLRGFVPNSLVSERFVRDLSQFKGQTLTFQVEECDVEKQRLILSRKAVAAAEKQEQLDAAYARLTEGDVVEGTVVRLAQFGAFVDLGGVDGLVHVTELAHDRIVNPAKVLEVGQKVSVKVLSVDKENNRIALSIKATTKSPWEAASEQLEQGQVINGVVRRLTDFGAFVEVLPGIDGLVHVSQISHDRVNNPADVLAVNQEVTAKILEFSAAEKRVSLSVKALLDKPVSNEEVVEEVVEEETYDVQSENTTVTLGDVLGDQLTIEE